MHPDNDIFVFNSFVLGLRDSKGQAIEGFTFEEDSFDDSEDIKNMGERVFAKHFNIDCSHSVKDNIIMLLSKFPGTAATASEGKKWKEYAILIICKSGIFDIAQFETPDGIIDHSIFIEDLIGVTHVWKGTSHPLRVIKKSSTRKESHYPKDTGRLMHHRATAPSSSHEADDDEEEVKKSEDKVPHK